VTLPSKKLPEVLVDFPESIEFEHLRLVLALALGVPRQDAPALRLEVTATIMGSKRVPKKGRKTLVSRVSQISSQDVLLVSNWNRLACKRDLELSQGLLNLDVEHAVRLEQSLLSVLKDPKTEVILIDSADRILKNLGFKDASTPGRVSLQTKGIERIENAVDLIQTLVLVEKPVFLHFVDSESSSPASSSESILLSPRVRTMSIPVEVELKMDESEVGSFRASSAPERLIGEDVDVVVVDSDIGRLGDSKSRRRKQRKQKRKERERARAGSVVVVEDFEDMEHPAMEELDLFSPSSAHYDQLEDMAALPEGLEPAAIARLPVQIVTAEDLSSMKKRGQASCQICLSEYVVDERLLRLPCFHSYHEGCISKWLSTHNKCPQDRITVRV